MAAIVAARYNPDVKALYERLVAKGKSKMLVLLWCSQAPIGLFSKNSLIFQFSLLNRT